jgi:hypothetical protein
VSADPRLFALDASVPPGLSARLVELTLRDGERAGGVFAPESPPAWAWLTLRRPVESSVPAAARAALEPLPAARRETWAYFSRLDPALEWEWAPGEAAGLVRELLAPLARLGRVTRVKAILPLPGVRVPAHRDLVPGNEYDGLAEPCAVAQGARRLRYQGVPWLPPAPPTDAHRAVGYLSLKIPISERPGDAGRPFVIMDGRRRHYSSRGRLFFLNEYELLHGADPVDFWRGVVFVSGFWDPAALASAARRPVDIIADAPAGPPPWS